MTVITNSDCEAWFNDQWSIISVETALTYPELHVRCAECKGAIRLHKAGPMNKPRAHAEHRKRFNGCSLGDRFDGFHRINSDTVGDGENTGLTLLIAEEVPEARVYHEGATVSVLVNRFERDRNARKACIKHHGMKCAVCEFNFKEIYGEVAKNIIHVHHITPLSEIKQNYVVDPIKDLIPVCPNCHAVIHSAGGPYSLAQMKNFIKVLKLDS
jgi:hypothetical protein